MKEVTEEIKALQARLEEVVISQLRKAREKYKLSKTKRRWQKNCHFCPWRAK